VDDVRDPGRRRFTKYALIAGLGAAASAGIGGLIAFLYPRSEPGDAPLRVANDTIPGPGAPPLALAGGSVLLVNLRPGEGVTPRNLDVAGGSPPAPGDARGGLLAMHALCTHLHCNVRWRPDLPLELDGVAYEAFACPCHGALQEGGRAPVRAGAAVALDAARGAGHGVRGRCRHPSGPCAAGRAR
jgi:Rieske Fe-S protein